MLSEGVNKGRISMEKLVEVCCHNPAKVLGIHPQKGTIAVGSDADLVIVDLDESRSVKVENLHTASDFTPYEGRELKGWPVLTMVGGNIVMEDGEITGKPGVGKYIPRKFS
jgi:dihydropyrimidinase